MILLLAIITNQSGNYYRLSGQQVGTTLALVTLTLTLVGLFFANKCIIRPIIRDRFPFPSRRTYRHQSSVNKTWQKMLFIVRGTAASIKLVTFHYHMLLYDTADALTLGWHHATAENLSPSLDENICKVEDEDRFMDAFLSTMEMANFTLQTSGIFSLLYR